MNLREAAAQALEALEEIEWSNNSQWQSDRAKVSISALRAALAEDAMQRLADEQQMIERGTKAWADVPDATAWVDEMRGNVPAPTSQESRQVEPVAYIHETGFLVRNPAATLTAGMKLYSAPPKREPMTDEEVGVALGFGEYTTASTKSTLLNVARAIERAHGIGGEE